MSADWRSFTESEKLNKILARLIFLISITALLSSCLGTRYLQDDQYLLRKQKIKGVEEANKEELEALYKQKTNKKIPLLPVAPYVWIYHLGKKHYDKDRINQKIDKIKSKYNAQANKYEDHPNKVEKIEKRRDKKIEKKRKALEDGNMLMRWGEPLAVYNDDLASQTRDQMQLYLETKGFFHTTVNYSVKYFEKMAYVTYHIDEGQPFVIDTVIYTSTDSSIVKIIKNNMDDSNLVIGDHYDQGNLTQERERIDALLKNHGYFDFSRQYIVYKIDTLQNPFKASINMLILNPAKRGYHKVFSIDSVIFVTDAGITPVESKRSNFSYNEINYQYYVKRFNKKILDQRVFIREDSSYSLDNTLNTQRQLAFLNNFKFININYDTTGGKFIANIFTSPLKKYQITNEFGLNVTEGYPGPFYNLSLTQRNVFGGLENLELSGYIGFEGVASVTTQDIYSSLESGGKLSLIFPQFIIPGGDAFKRRFGNLNPNTTLRTGFSYTNRPEYTRSSFSSSLAYSWQQYRRKIYNFTLADVSLINSITTSEFQDILDTLEQQGNPLSKSFNPSFVNSINFYVMYNFNPDDLLGNKSSLLKLYAESGGTIFNFIKPTLLDRYNLEHYQFLKFSVDFRRHITISENKGIATRINLGMAYPYGSNKSLPYEKYFFAGGSNSIRAWPPRRLGPGSAPPRKNENPEKQGLYDYSIEKPGEILMEASVEYRSKLIAFIDWAAFIDAGNVWRIVQAGKPARRGFSIQQIL